MISNDINDLKIVEINDIKTIDMVISKCDDAFQLPITKRVEYLQLLQKYSTKGCFAYAVNDDVLGYIAFYINDKTSAYISLIAVNPDYQNNHVGGALLRYCENKAKINNIPYVRLEVKKNNLKAFKFYKANDYELERDKDQNSLYMKKKI